MNTLGDTPGNLYVTYAAAKALADATGAEPEEARRELTDMLLDARAGGRTETGAERWRYRNGERIDIEAHVVREGRLAMVVHAHVRRAVRWRDR